MAEIFEPDIPGENAPEFTVSEISGAVKRLIEGEFSHVRVRGEIGRVSRPRSGHVYLDLKDERAVLAGVIWRGVAQRLQVQPEEGMEVIATGRLTTFPGQSKYQIVIESLSPAGVGALMAMLERRRKALAAEGLFAAERKRPLPFLPEVIGVVTSPSGAVIRDILHRLRDRFPRRVVVWPVAVQGERCAPEVARAVRGFNALPPGGPVPRPDVIIVARGGGSIEDLWGFNEEEVVRAVADSAIPVISAVGHETDTTLIDHAADRRAPTPTAAAEMAVPVRLELLATVEDLSGRLGRAAATGIERRRQRVADLGRLLPRPEALVQPWRQTLDHLDQRLPAALRALARERRLRYTRVAAPFSSRVLLASVARHRERLTGLSGRLAPAMARRLADARREAARTASGLRPQAVGLAVQRARRDFDALSRRLAAVAEARQARLRDRLAALERMRQTLGYKETLRRGYAVVRAGAAVVTRAAEARRHDALEIEFHDGKVPVRVGADGEAPEPPKRGGPRPGPGSGGRGRSGRGRGDDGQGSLF